MTITLTILAIAALVVGGFLIALSRDIRRVAEFETKRKEMNDG
jgi:formate hydrogenlyase subunit 3/multisubunit Na+/H+ antiporter MnhD subunit